LMPRPPRLDTVRLHALADVLLRFEAKIVNGQKEDAPRRFIVGVRPADNKVGCWEVRQRNSGQTEGKFAEMARKRKSDGEWYTPQDFFVGAVVKISGTDFKLVRADEYSAKYMEQNGDEFPKSNAKLVLHNIAPLVRSLQAQGLRKVNPENFLARLNKDKTEPQFTEQEVVTLVRHIFSNEVQIGGFSDLASRGIDVDVDLLNAHLG